MRPPVPLLTASVLVSLLFLGTSLRGVAPLVEVDGAYIEPTTDGWAIGNGSIRYAVGTSSGTIGVRAIEQPESGRDWQRGTSPDAAVRINGQLVTIGSSSTPFQRAEAREWSGGARLDLAYRFNRIDITRSYVCYPDSAVIEMWTTFRQTGSDTTTLSDLTSYNLSVQNGTLHWISGLQTPDETSTPFNRLYGDLDDGQTFDLGSDRRASEQSLPWFSISSEGEEFFGSILWSGSWRFQIERRGDTVNLHLGLPPFDTSLAAGASLETPHAIFGVTGPTATDPSIALRGFIDRGLRHGRLLNASVAYNTWYSKGTFVDEPSMLAEMEVAAGIGVELFVIDAGWWLGANQNDFADFGMNWGNWQVDPDRFPSGLRALSDRAHELGMWFGVWVEPERVDRVTVGRPGLAQERFLASDGRSDPVPIDMPVNPISGRRRAQPRVPIPGANPIQPNDQTVSAQICLADPAARQWVLAKLVAFVEEVHPDYLKWDNNLWVNCSRAGHGHGTGDANFLHHRALGNVLDELRARFPDLEIENCSSGGNRLSLDMLAHTDSAWMDDRTGPAARVRHGLEGLLTFLPPHYLLSFATTIPEGIDEWHFGDAAYVFRSRMLGMPGLSWPLSTMDDTAIGDAARQVAVYKRLRPYQQRGSALLLSNQVQPGEPGTWDAVEFLLPGGKDAAVVAYNSFDSPPIALLRVRGLRPDDVYHVESVDAGFLGDATGRELMERGIELQTAEVALGHVIFLHAE